MKERQPPTWLIPSVIGLFVFGVYFATLCPTIPEGDGGQLTAAAYNWGVAHPPGYPIYMVLAKFFTMIPYGSVAARVNLLSAACSAAASALLFLTMRHWTKSQWAGIASAGLFAFSPLVWRYAVISELFALNNVFVIALFYLFLRFHQTRLNHYALIGAFVFGLGLAHLQTILFFGLPIAFFVLSASRERLKLFLRMCLAVFLGLLPYAYLPFSASLSPLVTWGDGGSLSGFFAHILRSDYGLLKLGPTQTKPEFLFSLSLYLQSVFSETLFIGVVLALFGIRASLKNEKKAKIRGPAFTSVCAFGLYMLVFHALANLPINEPHFQEVHSKFWLAPNLFVFMWIGVGFAEIEKQFKTRYLAPAIALGLCLIQITTHYQSEDQSQNWSIHRFGEKILNSLPEHALIISEGDNYTNTLRYLQGCEGLRPDVRIIDAQMMKRKWHIDAIRAHFPDVEFPPGVYSQVPEAGTFNLDALFKLNQASHPLFTDYVIFTHDDPIDTSWAGTFEMLPYGFLYEVAPAGQSIDPLELIKRQQALTDGVLDNSQIQTYKLLRDGAWEKTVWKILWDVDNLAASFALVNLARGRTNGPLIIEAAIAFLEAKIQTAQSLSQEIPQTAYNNLEKLRSFRNRP